MALCLRAKVLLNVWSYDFMTRRYPLHKATSCDKVVFVVLLLYVHGKQNSYSHVGQVSSSNHTIPGHA